MISLRRLTVHLGLLGACAHALNIVPACNSSVYCVGELLHKVQLARIFNDSKSFVDMKMVLTERETLADFDMLMRKTNGNPSKHEIKAFVSNHFENCNELVGWIPPDFNPEPPILEQIADPEIREFAKNIISIWEKLGRKVDKDVANNPERYSFLYIPNGFIVPGGRFSEIYYWDSFWIIRGLLISNMTETARGMIENLLYLVEKYGYVPNGSRVYYLGRSQPPLLAAMVGSYVAITGDLVWLKKHLPTVEKELLYWITKKKIDVEVKGRHYYLLRYISNKESMGPRPESYYEDYYNSRNLSNEAREDFYREMKSAAESGWDFSSRWLVAADTKRFDLTDVHTSRILPVDLNAIFAGALQLAGDFRNSLKQKREAQKWWKLAKYWRHSIQRVLWDDADGIWYDYDAKAKTMRRQFYPSCVTPLWAGAVEDYDAPHYASRVIRYLFSTGVFDYPGGIPASLYKTGEQWDFPNAWPPSQSILIGGLEASGYDEAKALARRHARLWIKANYLGYNSSKKMYEKYNAKYPGKQGTGGEYLVQDGFGWTNGVALELLQMYGKDLIL